MRTDLAYMRLRAFTVIATLCALALVPSTALAAPKKVSFRFSATAYSVVEANTAFNVTVQRTGNTRVAASVRVSDQGTGTAVTSGPNPNYDAFTPQVLNFAAGETSKTVQVTIHDNTTFDPPNKTIVMLLDQATSSSPAGAKIATPTTTITILDNDGPGTIDFSSSTYSVVENAGVATVTVNRNSATNISESVDYTTTALAAGTGNATAGVDYMTSSGTLTFAAGEMSKTFQVPILDDTLYEGNEVLDLTLSNPQNLTNPASVPVLGPNNSVPATLTIVDDDVPIFDFSQPTYSVSEAAGTATITVTRSGATNVAASIDYSDAGTGSAATPADYTLAGGTLAFAAGETTKTFTVGIVNNGVGPEPNKTVGLRLTQGGVQVATATLSIVDDDNPIPSVQFSNVSYSVSETAASVIITATLSKAYDGDVTVNYATSDGTATAGAPMVNPDGSADYQATSGTLTFYGNIHNGGAGAGDTTKTFQVPINPDTVVEGDEIFNVTLSGNSANSTLGAPATAPVTIVDDDQAGSLELTSLRYDVNETDGQATVTVRRVGGTGGAVSVDYATSDGSAHAPGDYATTTGTLNFADGETQKTFAVPVVWDGLAEGDETVNLALSNPGGGSDLGANTAAALHIADDGASGPVQFSAAGYTVGEAAGMATVTVTRTGGSLGGPVTVDYATSDGTATAGSDYGEMHGTLTFNAGETTKTFQVPVINDSVHEGDETVALTLSNPGGGTSLGTRASALLTIVDDDPAPAVAPPADQGSTPGPQSSPANPNPAGSQTSAVDKTAPKLTLTAKALQKALKAKLIALSARCNERCSLLVVASVAKGRKAVLLGRVTVKVSPAGKTVQIKVKLSKQALTAIRKALSKGKAKVTLKVTAADAAGNKAGAVRRITVR
jgi:hypothetical protein